MIFKKVLSPISDSDFNSYYYFRWLYLRKPLNKKIGSERDDIEGQSIHRMVINKEKKIIAIGRLHDISPLISQVRYFAVDKDYRRKGIGKYLMHDLESIACNRNKKYIVLNARENAIPFYKNLDYNIVEKTNLLYGKIQHYKMKKTIQSNQKFK